MQNTALIPSYPDVLTTDNKDGRAQLMHVMKVLFEKNDHSGNTRKALASDVRKFGTWFEAKNGERFSFSKIAPLDVVAFRDDLKAYQKPSTVNRALTHVRILLQCAVDERFIDENPAEKVKALKVVQLAPKGLTPEDARRLLRTVQMPQLGKKRKKSHIAKHFAIVKLMMSAGLRVSEVTNLIMRDVKMTERGGHVLVRDSKGGKTREVPLSKLLRDAISEHWRFYRPEDVDAPLFVNDRGGERGRAITTTGIAKLVRFYGDRAGIEKLSPHRLRHTFAFNYLIEKNHDLVGLRQILGHSNINVTAHYAQNSLYDLQAKVENLSL